MAWTASLSASNITNRTYTVTLRGGSTTSSSAVASGNGYWRIEYSPTMGGASATFNNSATFTVPGNSSTQIASLDLTGGQPKTTYTIKGTWTAGSATATTTIYVTTLPNSCPVDFDANGGNSTPASKSCWEGEYITLPGAITRNSSTSTSNETITISYNANGGSSTPPNSTGTAVNTTTTSYSFAGWAEGRTWGTIYPAGSVYYPDSIYGTTMYARWNESSSTSRTSNPSITLASGISRANDYTAGYNITYNANGGSGAPNSEISGNRAISYTFSKWAAGSLGGTTYNAGSSYVFSSNTTMYATWTSSTSANSSWTCSSMTPTRTGYTFKGWATSAGATTATYQPGQTYTITSGLTLYAVWQINYYYLDLAGYLDGKNSDTIYDFGTCDVYINGSKVATGVTDYYAQHPYGSSYEFKNIVSDWGCEYKGVQSGSLSGTLGVGGATTRLSFIRYPVVINANANNSWQKGIVWVNVNGEWKKARALNINNNNEWKRLEKYDFTL